MKKVIFTYLLGIFCISASAQKVKIIFGVDMRTTDSFEYYTKPWLIYVKLFKNNKEYKQLNLKQETNRHIFSSSDSFNIGDTLYYLFNNGQKYQSPQTEIINRTCSGNKYRQLIVPNSNYHAGYPLFYYCKDSTDLVNVTFRVIGKYERFDNGKVISVAIAKDSAGKNQKGDYLQYISFSEIRGKYAIGSKMLVRNDTVYFNYGSSYHLDFFLDSGCMGRLYRRKSLVVKNDTILTPVLIGHCDTNYKYQTTLVQLEKNGINLIGEHPYMDIKNQLGAYLWYRNSTYYSDTLFLYRTDTIKMRFSSNIYNEQNSIKGACIGIDGYRPAVYKGKNDTTIYACFGECIPCEKTVVFRVRVADNSQPQDVYISHNFNGYSLSSSSSHMYQNQDTATHLYSLQTKFRRFDTLYYRYVLSNARLETAPDSCSKNGYRYYVVGEADIQYLPTYQFGTCNTANYSFGNGISAFAFIPFNIFPNPTSDFIHLDMNGMPPGKYMVKLSDGIGKNIYATPVTNSLEKINMETLPSGTYFITLYKDDELVAGKVVVKP